MTTFLKNILLFTSIAFISCGQEKKEEPPKDKSEIRYEKRKQLDTLNQNEAISLTNKYAAITGNDSTLKFTYQLQEIIKENNKVISLIGNINDVVQKESNFVLRISGRLGKRTCFGEVIVSPEIFQKLKDQLNSKLPLNKCCFIIKPTSIRSGSLLNIDADVHTNDDAETVEDANASAEAELTYDYDHLLLFIKGSLVDIYMYKKLPKDED